MGVSGNDSCCSQLVKYGMFISNLIIFVSKKLHFAFSFFNLLSFALLPLQCRKVIAMLRQTGSNPRSFLTDWRCNCICDWFNYTRGSQLPKWAIGHESLFGCRICARHHLSSSVSLVVLRMLRCSQGNQMHAANGMWNSLEMPADTSKIADQAQCQEIIKIERKLGLINLFRFAKVILH